MRTLKVNDFFCGCGGMGLAFQNAGFEIVGAWDFDKFAVQSYKENVDDSVVKADIKKMTWEEIPKADVWTFGFPCQDLSNAGKQAGLVLKCQNCGEILKITPEEYTGETYCQKCGCANMKAESRSGCFFEIMRLLDETEENRPENMPYVILAENVRALTPYLPILQVEYKKRGYLAQSQLFNSKYWNVPQSRDRYAVVGTYEKKNVQFTFPVEQHDYIPKLSTVLEENVDEKYYIADEKAKTIIGQALERLKELGKVHACITPDRINKRQNGPRAKAEEEPMFTLTAQDLHGIIIEEGEGGAEDNERMAEDAPCFPICEATQTGVAVGLIGDSINIAYPGSPSRRGRIGKEIAQTLLTNCQQVVICERNDVEEVQKEICEETGLLDPNGCGKTLRVGGAEA